MKMFTAQEVDVSVAKVITGEYRYLVGLPDMEDGKGAVSIIPRDGGMNVILVSDVPKEGSRFGASVACNREMSVVAVAEPGWKSEAPEKTGSVHIFREVEGEWKRVQVLMSNTSVPFGVRVLIVGGYLFVQRGTYVADDVLLDTVVVYKEVDGVWVSDNVITYQVRPMSAVREMGEDIDTMVDWYIPRDEQSLVGRISNKKTSNTFIRTTIRFDEVKWVASN